MTTAIQFLNQPLTITITDWQIDSTLLEQLPQIKMAGGYREQVTSVCITG